jgi:hypothetical protein
MVTVTWISPRTTSAITSGDTQRNLVPGTTVHVWYGLGDGTFPNEREYAVGQSPHDLAFGDVDADGRADLIVANTTSSTVSVIRVDSAGDVESDHDYPSLNWLNLIAAVDVMATDTKTFSPASENASSLALQLGASDASLSPCQTITSFQIPQGLSARDVDGDGHADLVLSGQTCQRSGHPTWQCDGTFAAADRLPH